MENRVLVAKWIEECNDGSDQIRLNFNFKLKSLHEMWVEKRFSGFFFVQLNIFTRRPHHVHFFSKHRVFVQMLRSNSIKCVKNLKCNSPGLRCLLYHSVSVSLSLSPARSFICSTSFLYYTFRNYGTVKHFQIPFNIRAKEQTRKTIVNFEQIVLMKRI